MSRFTTLVMGFFASALFLGGCTHYKAVHTPTERPPEPLAVEDTFERNLFSISNGDGVIGELRMVRIERGDTLPDMAKHFGVGLNGVNTSNPGVDTWVPEPGRRIILPMKFTLPDAHRKGIVINLAAMRLFRFNGNGQVMTFPVGVGAEDRPSPMGLMTVERKVHKPTWHVPASIAASRRKRGDILPAAIPPGPKNPLGEYALYLSRPTYLIHGTNKPASIGLQATNGCIRLHADDIRRLFEITPVKTPVNIVSQPYLLGQRRGVLYLEVHAPLEKLDAAEFYKVYNRLKDIERKSGRSMDWKRVKLALAEARGIPVPVYEITPGSEKGVPELVEICHPLQLSGTPRPPALRDDAWSVLASETRDETDAVRMAAIINHQGPSIPAHVVRAETGFKVIAGPFRDVAAARDVLKRLKIDLELEGRLIAPVKRNKPLERR